MPFIVSMISGDDKCFVCGQTGHFGHHCPGVQCYTVMNLAILPRTVPTWFLHQEHHGRSCSVHWYTHNWRDRPHSYYGPRHRRRYSRSQSIPHSHHDISCNFRRHTSHSSSTTAACATLQLLDAPAMITTGIVAPLPHLPFFLQEPLTAPHRPKLLLLQQLPPYSTRFLAQEDKAMP